MTTIYLAVFDEKDWIGSGSGWSSVKAKIGRINNNVVVIIREKNINKLKGWMLGRNYELVRVQIGRNPITVDLYWSSICKGIFKTIQADPNWREKKDLALSLDPCTIL